MKEGLMAAWLKNVPSSKDSRKSLHVATKRGNIYGMSRIWRGRAWTALDVREYGKLVSECLRLIEKRVLGGHIHAHTRP